MNPIEITSLTKSYGTFAAVRDLSFSVPEGSICGLLGPNGAGKSSTFKCMTGLARPTSGSIAIDGGPVRPEMFEHVAFVPEKSALYDRLTAADHLEMMRRAYKNYDAARAKTLLDLFALDAKKKIFRLSKGQRTALALVLVKRSSPGPQTAKSSRTTRAFAASSGAGARCVCTCAPVCRKSRATSARSSP